MYSFIKNYLLSSYYVPGTVTDVMIYKLIKHGYCLQNVSCEIEESIIYDRSYMALISLENR